MIILNSIITKIAKKVIDSKTARLNSMILIQACLDRKVNTCTCTSLNVDTCIDNVEPYEPQMSFTDFICEFNHSVKMLYR
jgi:hypothetical protein